MIVSLQICHSVCQRGLHRIQHNSPFSENMADIWKIHPSNNSNKDGNYKIRKHWRWSFSNGAWLANTCGSESIFKLSQNSRLHLFVFHCAREHNELHLNIYNTPLMLIESSHTLPRTSPSLQLKPGAPKVHSDGWMTLERSKIALGLCIWTQLSDPD